MWGVPRPPPTHLQHNDSMSVLCKQILRGNEALLRQTTNTPCKRCGPSRLRDVLVQQQCLTKCTRYPVRSTARACRAWHFSRCPHAISIREALLCHSMLGRSHGKLARSVPQVTVCKTHNTLDRQETAIRGAPSLSRHDDCRGRGKRATLESADAASCHLATIIVVVAASAATLESVDAASRHLATRIIVVAASAATLESADAASHHLVTIIVVVVASVATLESADAASHAAHAITHDVGMLS